MDIKIGAIIIAGVGFLYGLTARYIKNKNFRLSSYVWFPLLASISFYWLLNIDALIHPEKHEGGWAWFIIILWTISGQLTLLAVLFLKWFTKKY